MFAAHSFWADPEYRLVGGLLATCALAFVPLGTFGLQKSMDIYHTCLLLHAPCTQTHIRTHASAMAQTAVHHRHTTLWLYVA